MPFKSQLAVLVLMLCWLHLTGRADSHTTTTITQLINRDKAVQTDVKSPIQPTDTNKTALDIQSTNKDKTAQTTIKKITHTAKEEKTTPDSLPTNRDKTAQTTVKKITHTAKEEKTTPDSQPTSTTQHISKDKALTSTESPKKPTRRSDTTSHNGGSSATIPSVFTIASLICVLLL